MLDWLASTLTTTLMHVGAPGPHSGATISEESHDAATAAEGAGMPPPVSHAAEHVVIQACSKIVSHVSFLTLIARN